MPIPRNKGNEILVRGGGWSAPKPCALRMGKGGSSGGFDQKGAMDAGQVKQQKAPTKSRERDEVVSTPDASGKKIETEPVDWQSGARVTLSRAVSVSDDDGSQVVVG